MFKSGFVSIIGKPNVGKSTFLNSVLKMKLVITSPKAQTTRNVVTGIYNNPDAQIIFLDTPGIHDPKNKLDTYMTKMSYNSTLGVDLVIYMINAYDTFNEEDEKILTSLKQSSVKTFLVINKLDLIKDYIRLEKEIARFKEAFSFDGVFAISALNGDNVERLINDIVDSLEEGPMYYPSDQITDRPEKFIVAELIREKILALTHNEVPHSVMVEIEKFKYDQKKELLIISAVIVVERESQKWIIVGHNGQMIKKIGEESRLEIEAFLGEKVYLELFAKVEENWRNKEYFLKNFGYKQELE